MAGASILWRNLATAEAATARASSSLVGAPASLLIRNPHTRVRWTSLSGAPSVFFDLGSEQQADIFGLVGTLADTFRLRLSADDPDCEAGDLHDGEVEAVNADTMMALTALESPVAARYGRIDLVGGSVVGAGVLVAGLRWEPAATVDFGKALGFTDAALRTVALGLQIHVDEAPERMRTLEATFSWLSEAEANVEAASIARENGLSRDILFMPDWESPDLNAQAIWGLLKALHSRIVRKGNHWSTTYSIEERP